ncbi:hypothetical protein OH77DRAFT_588089 [Trametes cingulata]|nr:hypothetical protein OH77DRAFT_588089 [Trametes cingulata]
MQKGIRRGSSEESRPTCLPRRRAKGSRASSTVWSMDPVFASILAFTPRLGPSRRLAADTSPFRQTVMTHHPPNLVRSLAGRDGAGGTSVRGAKLGLVWVTRRRPSAGAGCCGCAMPAGFSAPKQPLPDPCDRDHSATMNIGVQVRLRQAVHIAGGGVVELSNTDRRAVRPARRQRAPSDAQ